MSAGPVPCSPCQWSQWFDTSFPTLGPHGGDSETYKDIQAAGYSICDQPSQIECRAKKFPNVTINKVGQVVQCDLANGLTCRNQDQAGPLALCFNYQVRVLCCDYVTCPTKPPPTTPPQTQLTTTTSQPTTTLTESPTPCETTCEWSKWISIDYPQISLGGGDIENITTIIQKGYDICETPVAIKCQAVHFPGVALSTLGQMVECNTQVGLICENKDQNPPICYDYEIKVECCKKVNCQTTKPTTPETTPTTKPSPSSTVTENHAPVWIVKSINQSPKSGCSSVRTCGPFEAFSLSCSIIYLFNYS